MKIGYIGASGLMGHGMAKTRDGDLTGLTFELDNARKDIRYYTHLAEGMDVPKLMGEAQERITGANLVPHISNT